MRHPEREEPEHRPQLHRVARRRWFRHLPARLCRVSRADVDRHARFGPQPFGEADVVDVPVRQQQRLDVVQRPAEHSQLALQVIPQAGQSGIDDRELPAIVDQIAVDQARRPESMEMRSEFHGTVLACLVWATHSDAARPERGYPVEMRRTAYYITITTDGMYA